MLKMESHKIIKNPISTEKAIRLMESQNTLLFAVDLKATKTQIKEAIQDLFNVKVAKVNTYITPKGDKKAYVKLTQDHIAMDLATNLGMI